MIRTLGLWTFRKCRTHTVCFYVFLFFALSLVYALFEYVYMLKKNIFRPFFNHIIMIVMEMTAVEITL